MKKLTSKKLMLISSAILIIIIGIVGSVILHKRGADGEDLTVIWALYLVAILAILDFAYLIVRPIVRMIQGKDDEPPPEFTRHLPPANV
jgi:nitrogen fixation/metabolism regulation signal transduction histidine kinase